VSKRRQPGNKQRRGGAPLALAIHAATGKELVPYLRKKLLEAHKVLGGVLGELSVALVGDRRMSQLHEQFMGISGPTDVLTFPLEQDARGRVTSGEVIVCVPEARRRARGPLREEVLLYALHGMLHLSGFDDRTESAYRTMHRMEDDILTRIGVGRVFAPVNGQGTSRGEKGKRQTVKGKRKASRVEIGVNGGAG
jgi:probable rRNA maturation factor